MTISQLHQSNLQLYPLHQNRNMELKQALAQLIDAYADAKASKNTILLQYATQELQRFIEGVELVQYPAAQAPQSDED